MVDTVDKVDRVNKVDKVDGIKMEDWKLYEYGFEKLDVYKIARKYVKEVYHMTNDFPHQEKYALANQIQRAVVSITSNLAEGTSRKSNVDKAHFVEMAYGSLLETLSQLYNAVDLGYIEQEKLIALRPMIDSIGYKLTNLRKSYLDENL